MVGIHEATVGIGQLKFHAGKQFAGHAILLHNDQAALLLVIEAKCLNLAFLDLDGLGSGIQNESIRCLGLSGGHSGAGNKICDDDASCLIGDELAVALTHHRAAGVGHQESHTLDGGRGTLDVFLNDQSGAGGISEMEGLSIIGVDHHSLGLGGRIDGVAGNGLDFRHYQRSYHTVDLNLALLISYIQAVAGDVAIFVRHILTAGGGDLEGDAGQGLPGERVPLVNNQGSGLGVFDDYGLRIALGSDDHIGRGLIHHIPFRGLDFRNYISAGDQVCNPDLTAAVCGKNAILGEGAVTDDAIQPDFAPGSSGHPELSTGQGLVGFAVPLLDD